ncbi:MAG: mechanosensitive ion channel family protein [Prochlorotrichaceae cyanobacterium]
MYLTFSLWAIEKYLALYQFIQFILYLALSIEIAWLLSRIIRKFIRDYIIEFNQNLGKGTNDIILILEFLVNLIVGFFAVIIFAQSQNIDLSFVLTQVGISGVAIAFASKKVLEQLVGTIAIYLDRPYRIGDYIRVNFNPKAEDLYARVESIGIRSTKLRVVATNTLVIAPNSLMASKDIENISKGTKEMVLFHLNFENQLLASEQALVQQIIQSITHENFGVDPGSTFVEVSLSKENEFQSGTCFQVSLFMLVPDKYGMLLHRQTIESIHNLIIKELEQYNFNCEIEDQSLYLDSPIPL